MVKISRFRLMLMRAMYLLIALGLSLTTLPGILGMAGHVADAHSVISSFLLALVILCLIGIAFPLKMLPILLFEVIWKSAWLLLFALPMWLKDSLDSYATSVAVACLMGVVLTPFAVPWNYAVKEYLTPLLAKSK